MSVRHLATSRPDKSVPTADSMETDDMMMDMDIQINHLVTIGWVICEQDCWGVTLKHKRCHGRTKRVLDMYVV